jgi:hypothetical protein
MVLHESLPLPPVQRLAAGPEPPRSLLFPVAAPSVMVQRAIDASDDMGAQPSLTPEPPAPPLIPAPPSMPAAPSLAGGEGAVATVASGAAAALPAGDLDALAGRLYDKIRYRLKAELRLDRERAGLITDRR